MSRIHYALMVVALPLILGLISGVLSVHAQSDSNTGETYTIHAGLSGQGNVRFLSFLPMSLQVHQGDTVTWVFGGGLHNVRFTEQIEWSSFLLPIEVDGTPHLIMDPRLSQQTVENGGSFTGDPLNSGVAFDMERSEYLFDAEAPYSYSLIINAEPGIYSYLCDLHPGMIGYLDVQPDDVDIPSPIDVRDQISTTTAATLDEATAQLYALENEQESAAEDGSLEVIAGTEILVGDVRVAIDRFYPATGVIHAGESVTWSLAADATVAHAIVSPYLGFATYSTRIEDAEGNTQIEFSPLALNPTLTDGTWDAGADYVNAGLVAPGQSITVTFPEPGVYRYSDVFEPGMTGTIVVLDAAS